MSSPSFSSSFSAAYLRKRLTDFPRQGCTWVALSGGGDSTALLLAMAELHSEDLPALQAVHVNHGLHGDAEQWAQHCQRLCERLNIALSILEVSLSDHHQGPEAGARQARYQAIESLLAPGDLLLTGHHLEDQAETLLLRALRGTGLGGLGAMPSLRPLGEAWLGRPLLEVSRAALQEFVVAQGERWIEDPGNLDLDLDRNYLRHEVLPRLRHRWPATDRSLARLAQNAREGESVIAAQAAIDLAACQAADPRWLRTASLLALPAARRHNVLRCWLQQLALTPPGRDLMIRMLAELASMAPDQDPRWRWPGGEMRRFRDAITAFDALPDGPEARAWQPARQASLQLSCGTLSLTGSVPDDWRFQIRARQGGERIKPAGASCTRTLKNLLHELALPPWERDRLPLIFEQERLLAVADQVISEGLRERLQRHQLQLAWQPAYPSIGN